MPTILVVDDTPANLEIMTEILGSELDVRAVRSGARALKAAHSSPRPDLILLDIMMPEMDGYEVLERLKDDPSTADIPVIFVSALNSDMDEARGLALGAVDYISKPIRPAILMARVKTHLELAAARAELREHNFLLQGEVAQCAAEVLVAQDVVVRALAFLAEMRDPVVSNHLLRTQGFMRVLSRRLGCLDEHSGFLTPRTIEMLVRSTPLHDIGKIAVPEAILLKPGKLDEDEWRIVQSHSRLGRDALCLAQRGVERPIAFLSVAKEIAYAHHERWDGSGYPEGLEAERIPVSARLMAVADVFDALISVRSYKPAFSFDDAVEIIHAGRGTQFDPAVVDVFHAEQAEILAVASQFPVEKDRVTAADLSL